MHELLKASVRELEEKNVAVPGTLKQALLDLERADEVPLVKSDDAELTTWEIIRICLPAVAVSMGWACADALLAPRLIQLGVSPKVTNMIWLANPLLGVFLQPLVGAWSDNFKSKWGRRRPFLFVFHVGSMIGLLLVAFSEQLYTLWQGNELWRAELAMDGTRVPLVLVVIIFFGFGLCDMCHDLLLLPARALLNDQLPESQLRTGNRFFAAFSALGSILGMCMVLFPLETIPGLTLFNSNVSATFFVASCVVLMCNTFVLTYPEPPSETSETEDEEELGTFALLSSIAVLPRQLNCIYAIQFAWWYVNQNQTVWWTTWISLELMDGDFDGGVRWGVITLLLQACVCVLSTRTFVPWLGNKIGLIKAYHLSSFTYALGSLALYFIPSVWTPLVYMTLSGFMQPFMNSAPYVLIEMYLDDDDKPSASESASNSIHNASESRPIEKETEDADTTRGVLTALMNMCMVVAQIIVASTSGFIVNATGRISSAFLFSALFMIVLNALIYTMGWSFNTAEVETEEEEEVHSEDVTTDAGTDTMVTEDDLGPEDVARTGASGQKRNPRRSRRKLPVSGFGDAEDYVLDGGEQSEFERRPFKRVEYDSSAAGVGANNTVRKKITVALPKSQAKIMREHMKKYQTMGYGSYGGAYDEAEWDSEHYSSAGGAGENSAQKVKFRKANRFTRAGNVTVEQSDVLAQRRKEEQEVHRSRLASITSRRRRRRADVKRRASLASIGENDDQF